MRLGSLSKFIIPICLLSIFAGCSWTDSAPYVQASRNFRSDIEAGLKSMEEKKLSDTEQYIRCDRLRDDIGQLTPSGKHCLVRALTQASSLSGTISLTNLALRNLDDESPENELRLAARRGIELARTRLAAQKVALYDKMEAINKARDQSLIARIFVAPIQYRFSFSDDVARLNLTEFAIYMPKVNQHQQDWYVSTLLPGGNPAQGLSRPL